jgi:diguanylate cyclase (GGDEF)-like protein
VARTCAGRSAGRRHSRGRAGGLVDLITGQYVSLSIFYLVLVAVVAWRAGPVAGAAAVLAVLAVSLAAGLANVAALAGARELSVLTVAWNAAMRLTACCLVVVLVEMQRRALEREASLARTDTVTGVANRRHLVDAVMVELHRCERYHRPFSLVLLDVDRFKQINDEFGHDTGDAVLREVAQRLTERLRKVDLVARIGGDEFAVLLPETGLREARQVVRNLQVPLSVEVRRHSTSEEARSLEVQLSVGATTVASPGCGRSIEEVLDEADRAMYVAKRSRRPATLPSPPGAREHERHP